MREKSRAAPPGDARLFCMDKGLQLTETEGKFILILYPLPRGGILEAEFTMGIQVKPYLYWIFLAFMAVGFVYPAIGIAALVCMLAPVVLAPFKGRYWCGNYCPRGSFFDRIMSRWSGKRPIPPMLRSRGFRSFMVVFIMTVFTVQIVPAWGNLAAMGQVFLLMIGVTTVVGIALALRYNPRTWCAFCPMGTMANWASKADALPITVASSCVSCGLCKKVCPMELAPYREKNDQGVFQQADCLKCSRCIEICPKGAVAFSAAKY